MSKELENGKIIKVKMTYFQTKKNNFDRSYNNDSSEKSLKKRRKGNTLKKFRQNCSLLSFVFFFFVFCRS